MCWDKTKNALKADKVYLNRRRTITDKKFGTLHISYPVVVGLIPYSNGIALGTLNDFSLHY